MPQHLSPGRQASTTIGLLVPAALCLSTVGRLWHLLSGRPVRAIGKWPAYYLLRAAQPIYTWRGHRMASMIPLISYFNRNGYQGDPTRRPNCSRPSRSRHSENTYTAWSPVSYRPTSLNTAHRPDDDGR